MSGSKRTPGPWKTMDYLSRAEEIHGPSGQVLVMRMDGATLGDMLAMAAAPEQHAAGLELERLSLIIESAVRQADPVHHAAVVSLIKANRAALAKATGAAL